MAMNQVAHNNPIPHILMVSFFGQGHLNPLLRLAKRIAAKGLLVTFCTDIETGHKITSSTDTQPGIDHPIGFGFLRFEFLSDQLRLKFMGDDCSDESLNRLRHEGPKLLTEMIQRMADDGRPVSCLVNNPFMPWVQDVAADTNIPGAVLWVQSCAVFSIYYHYYHSLAEFPTETNPTLAVYLPGLPEFKHDELPTFLLPSDPYKSLKSVILEQFNNLSKASWVLLNTFEDIENEAIKPLLAYNLPLIPVGPLVEPEDDKNSKTNIRGDMFKVSDCMDWLDSQKPNSVVYIALGSIVALSKDEMAEMAFGLKSSGQPFLWVIRESQDKLPDGFVDEVKGKGLVVSWSDQERVLRHGSIACFLTHCGWNSTLEAATSGKPVIAYPQWGDQVTDAKFLVGVWNIGVRLSRPVVRDELQKCVESVIRGDFAEKIRSNAKQLSEIAEKAVAKGGSSERNIQAFVDEICRRTLLDQIVSDIGHLDLKK